MEYEQAINPDDICIKELDPNPPDRVFEIALPAHCVRAIMDRLESAGQAYEGERLFHLLVDFSKWFQAEIHINPALKVVTSEER